MINIARNKKTKDTESDIFGSNEGIAQLLLAWVIKKDLPEALAFDQSHG